MTLPACRERPLCGGSRRSRLRSCWQPHRRGLRHPAAGEPTGSVAAAPPAQAGDPRQAVELWGERYRANPRDPVAAVNYARRCAASASARRRWRCCEQASIHNPANMELLGAYGRALADVGKHEQALEVLNRAHTPDRPDWRILNVQGAVLDQLGQHQEAQSYYATALRIAPEEPSVLSNLGLSYALSKNLPEAEATLRRAAAGRAPIRACGRISRWWSDCRAASPKPKRSRAPICRPNRRPPMSPICGRCSRSRTRCRRARNRLAGPVGHRADWRVDGSFLRHSGRREATIRIP